MRWTAREGASLDRREFGRLAGGGALAACAAELVAGPAPSAAPAPANVPGRALMKVGTQHDSSDETLAVLAAFGVNHVCSRLPSPRLDEHWSVEGLTRLRERIESFGIHLDMVPLPLSSSYITKAEMPGIMLGQSPERDREIDDLCRMIRNASRAGIPALKYNMSVLGVVRTEPTTGRGGARYSTFKYDQARQEPPLTEAGPVPPEVYWERITYFLDRVIPVAEEGKVRLACHPHDPGMPPGRGYRGVHTVLGSVEGLKRFVEIHASEYHGLNFCQGTVAEMLEDLAVVQLQDVELRAPKEEAGVPDLLVEKGDRPLVGRVVLLPAPGEHLVLRGDDLLQVPVHEEDLVVVVVREALQEERDDLDHLAPRLPEPGLVGSLVEVLHPLVLVVALGVVLVGGAQAVAHDAQAARLEHLHRHRGSGAREAGDDDDRPAVPDPAVDVGHGPQDSLRCRFRCR